jgi:S1-C subfamily serine protease
MIMQPIIRTALLLLTIVLAAVATAQEISREMIWNENRQTAVQVKVSGRDADGTPVSVRTGSGVIVDPAGTIVTALHVVGRDEDWYQIPGSDGGRDRKIEVIGLDSNGITRPLGEASVSPVPSVDIAALYITATGLPAAKLADERPGELAPVVVILWKPDSNQPQPIRGDLVPTDRGKYGDLLTVEMSVVPGHSGSAVFDRAGKLVGIITNQLGDTQALLVPVDRFPPIRRDGDGSSFRVQSLPRVDELYSDSVIGLRFGDTPEDAETALNFKEPLSWDSLPIAWEFPPNTMVKFSNSRREERCASCIPC